MAFGYDDAAMIGASLLSAYLKSRGNDKTQLQSFDTAENRRTGIDPRGLMAEGVSKTRGVFDQAQDMLNRGIQMRSSYVQDLPQFNGPSMPMAFGVSGSDPANKNPSLLSLAPPKLGIGGMGSGGASMSPEQRLANGGFPHSTQQGSNPTEGTAMPRPAGQTPGTATPANTPHAASAPYKAGGDAQSAMAAFKMLGFQV